MSVESSVCYIIVKTFGAPCHYLFLEWKPFPGQRPYGRAFARHHVPRALRHPILGYLELPIL